MAVKPILKLGNPKLYEKSLQVTKSELNDMNIVVKDLKDTMMHFRKITGKGRAIAAPQIGVMKRLIYMNVNGDETVFINPDLVFQGNEFMEVWDDCMCFPEFLVRVFRYRKCRVRFVNLSWQIEDRMFEDDLSELFQHEYDHLDGVLAFSRAIDEKSFALASEVNK